MASANEPISCYFVANLGNAPTAIVERLERWADASCVEHAVHWDEDGSVALYAVKTSAKTARQYQSLLRTLTSHWKTSHWKMTFGKLDRGWLALLTGTEYRAAVAGATDHKACAAEVAAASEGTLLPLHGLGEASAPAALKLAERGVGHVILLSLSDGFDERAPAAYQRLLANRRTVCAA